MYTQGSPAHWNLIGHWMSAQPPVIAQQYSFTAFVSLPHGKIRRIPKALPFNFSNFLTKYC
jgi:hypothetical protein